MVVRRRQRIECLELSAEPLDFAVEHVRSHWARRYSRDVEPQQCRLAFFDVEQQP